MKVIEHKLDKAFQELSKGKPCYYCGKIAQSNCVHHLIRRANKVYRWERENGIVCCRFCHTKVHSGHLKEPKKSEEKYSYKEFLRVFQLTEGEFLKTKCEEFEIEFKEKYLKTSKSMQLKPQLKEKLKEIQKKSYETKKKFINQQRARL